MSRHHEMMSQMAAHNPLPKEYMAKVQRLYLDAAVCTELINQEIVDLMTPTQDPEPEQDSEPDE